MDAAKFVVVFDLDETLDQYYSLGKTCRTHEYKTAAGNEYVHMFPGLARVIASDSQIGGAIVLFSANLDDRTRELLSHVSLDDKPLLGHPWIGGVLTNSYLIQQEKTEPPGSSERLENRPGSSRRRTFDFSTKTWIRSSLLMITCYVCFNLDMLASLRNLMLRPIVQLKMKQRNRLSTSLAQVGDEIEWAFTQQSKSEKLSFAGTDRSLSSVKSR